MRMVHKDLDSNGSGSISLIPEYSEDLCYAYNDLIAPGDTVTAFTMVHQRDSERVIKLKLEVQVEEVEFDKDGFVLHIRGKNLTENDHLEIGASHTLEVQPNQDFELRKQVWDSLTLDTLEKDSSGELAVVLMQQGLAQVFLLALVRPSVINCCARIETPIPEENEHVFAYARDSALEKFFDQVVDAFVRHVDFSLVRCVVIASPGSTKDQFHRHLLLEAERRQLRPVMENRSRILVAHAISGHRHDLIGVLSDPDVKKFINDARAEREVKPRLNDFFNMLSDNPYLACYGPKHVELAHETRAIRKLVIVLEFFKDFDVKTIFKYWGLMESVKDSGGEVFLLSSMHVPVEQLEKLNGIAALLKFPLPELEDLEM